ncbi:MAG: hypothetical protein ACK41T_04325 [Pseudobdellovibrio sp.]
MSNSMQTWPYAVAKAKREHKKPCAYNIYFGDILVGMTFVFEIKWGPLHLIEIKRGPLMLKDGLDVLKDQSEFFRLFSEALNKKYPRRWLRWRQWLSDVNCKQSDLKSEFGHSAIEKLDWTLSDETYSTGLVDLKKSKEDLLRSFNSKWRNCLRKSQKQNLNVKIETDLEKIKTFIHLQNQYQQIKKFKSYSAQFLKEELVLQNALKSFFIVSAYDPEDKKLIASILITFHGQGATYRASFNTDLGRRKNAHYLLIWHAILELKSRNLEFLDLGGFLENEAPHVDHFKQGLNPQVLFSSGLWK